jgi:hypothetical protein
LNVHGINDVRQTEMHTAESLVHESNSFKAETAIKKLKKDINHQVLNEVQQK